MGESERRWWVSRYVLVLQNVHYVKIILNQDVLDIWSLYTFKSTHQERRHNQ